MMTILNTRHYMMEMIDQYKKKQIVIVRGPLLNL